VLFSLPFLKISMQTQIAQTTCESERIALLKNKPTSIIINSRLGRLG
jgi:hypothetical protein